MVATEDRYNSGRSQIGQSPECILIASLSVLTNLEDHKLVKSVFDLNLKIAVPDLLYEKEIKSHRCSELVNLGLSVEELEPKAISLAVQYKERFSRLCLAENFTLALAKFSGWSVLSDTETLCESARVEQIDCYSFMEFRDFLEKHMI